jgi:hypothetical protein
VVLSAAAVARLRVELGSLAAVLVVMAGCSQAPTFVDPTGGSGSGGTGGAGGSSASSSSSSSTGPGCSTPTECPGAENECARRTCVDGVCGQAFEREGLVVGVQRGGDCQVSVCGARGEVEDIPFPSDLPIDGEPCTEDVCQSGIPSNVPSAAGKPCGTVAPVQCSDVLPGTCTGCTTAADCAAPSACTSYACEEGTCVVINVADQTGAPPGDAPGDCLLPVCNGSGATSVIANPADPPVDGDACTLDLCTFGAPSNPPKAGIDDGERCTADTCDEVSGVVSHVAVGDGQVCDPACDAICTDGVCGTCP